MFLLVRVSFLQLLHAFCVRFRDFFPSLQHSSMPRVLSFSLSRVFPPHQSFVNLTCLSVSGHAHHQRRVQMTASQPALHALRKPPHSPLPASSPPALAVLLAAVPPTACLFTDPTTHHRYRYICRRTGFPLLLTLGATVHPGQGFTVNRAVVDIGSRTGGRGRGCHTRLVLGSRMREGRRAPLQSAQWRPQRHVQWA